MLSGPSACGITGPCPPKRKRSGCVFRHAHVHVYMPRRKSHGVHLHVCTCTVHVHMYMPHAYNVYALWLLCLCILLPALYKGTWFKRISPVHAAGKNIPFHCVVVYIHVVLPLLAHANAFAI